MNYTLLSENSNSSCPCLYRLDNDLTPYCIHQSQATLALTTTIPTITDITATTATAVSTITSNSNSCESVIVLNVLKVGLNVDNIKYYCKLN